MGVPSSRAGAQALGGTDVGVFQPDLDPATTTNPLLADHDGDGIVDGTEDADHDGLYEAATETDPLDRDSDEDGLPDGRVDLDADGSFSAYEQEDGDGDGVVDSGETDPRKVDTDADGLLDALELSLHSSLLLNDTDLEAGAFRPDRDPATVTDPTEFDTDVYSHRLDHMVVLPPGWLVIVLVVGLLTTGWGHPSLGCRSRRHR